ncbi:MAG: hypothetical protein A2898_03335 [Candidatus Kerfeldbacteria bacterium RIFCSPLOWO2_01_FULL_48_11]|uniref:YdhG-like domain-containing protein n=1 Tax=Candidatus Kerfeldbacteria bacterium RIFCSPLOWO2_01_FULL_48_11 TaxID=1798543 RepID=A0A1G2B2B7_9BACT|nr:MAG: hypothetical protein UY34_C0009G0014 [Parcubacteria group bacterium GW2011_GWA2_48_9]KKW16771.1 MAG: hypothetical protein UY52_C0001G0091 [Parcubacteria group bacterium GW2011_GWC2_49_9]OGY83298.1 MAG: hypothetical protein A2898_03335 [Candidatus Kerfeldbacteria bacterium RIFCSPLOWO2_01_FULL_48_11]HCJ52249.1 hypothetical protein [Candidatus Kerfeldbacteria bacterium]
MRKPLTVSEYIAKAPQPAQAMLKKIRATIRAAAPKAKEGISYGMPYYSYKGRLAYFAAFKDHVSYFAMPGHSIKKTLSSQINPYQTGKSTLQFPFGSAVPVALLKKIVKTRIKENLIKAEKK